MQLLLLPVLYYVCVCAAFVMLVAFVSEYAHKLQHS